MQKILPKTIIEDSKYCPGCGHGIITRLVGEVLAELKLENVALCAIAVGCACWLMDTFGVDQIQAPHGRAAAVATGLKRCRPDKAVFTYQGDGDASAIGLSETIWAAARNEKIVVIYVNNGVFGMTGGQMAPTTLEGQKTTTSIHGRDVRLTGKPLKILDMLRTLDIAYLARGAVTSVAEIKKTKRYLKNAFEAQMNAEGYSFVEIVSPCPTNWNLSPLEAITRMKKDVFPVYPLGEYIKRGEK